MANYNYSVTEIDSNSFQKIIISEQEKLLIDEFNVNSFLNASKHRVDLSIYSVENSLLENFEDYTKYSKLLNAQEAGKTGATNIVLDPEKDIQELGYESGDVILVYRFLNNYFSTGKFGGEFFIEDISSDGTEIRALSLTLTDNEVKSKADELKKYLNDSSFLDSFYLDFLNDTAPIGLNIDTEQTPKGLAIVLKLYEELPAGIEINSKFKVQIKVSEDKAYSIFAQPIEELIETKRLRGPNFQIESSTENNNPTEFFNYNDLFSYPATGSNFELHSLLAEKSAEISIEHNDFSNFIHFSSVEERIRNFKYKFQLLESYQDSLDTLNSSSYTALGISGSKSHYRNLITGSINNFDHYDRFLFFESGSNSWPKSSTKKPHVNTPSTSSAATSWFNSQIISASNYDTSNFDILINTIPSFIREDSNNEQYLMFIHMIGQHFDNLWVYFKAVSDKFDADNRMNFGISKDIVREAIESFGVNLYNSNQNLDNLFSSFIGETYNTGSELINSISVATSASFNSGSTDQEFLQPVGKDSYQKEIYKRIYHNLPYLLKTKGTERGVRALINCFGLPFDILKIKTFGGNTIDSPKFFGPEHYVSSSISKSIDTSITTSQEPSGSTRFHMNPGGKIRLDNTGSIATGSTLSRYTSIVNYPKKYTDDLHFVEVGFNISDATNKFIDLKISGSFDIDDYIGDPRLSDQSKYSRLNNIGKFLTNQPYTWDDIFIKWEDADWDWNTALEYSRSPNAFIRLLKFFDSSLFRIIKDFIPVRAKASTGAIIESHKLNRSKIKQVSGSLIDTIYSGSKSVITITGSQGGSFENSSSFGYTTNYNQTISTPIGPVPRNVTDESPQLTGEFSGSLLISTDGEVGKLNPFINLLQPNLIFDLNLYNLSLPIPPACIIQISSSYIGEYYQVFSTGSIGDAISGSVQLTYPTTGIASEGSITFTQTFDVYEFFSVEADESYVNTFLGWYTQFPTGSGETNLISTSSILNIYYTDEDTYGNKFYAVFD